MTPNEDSAHRHGEAIGGNVATQDFAFEFHSELPQPTEELRAEAERWLRQLSAGQTDVIGASVALQQLIEATTPYKYEARVVVYMKPTNVAATRKAEFAADALRSALDAVERQVRGLRDRLRKPWKRP